METKANIFEEDKVFLAEENTGDGFNIVYTFFADGNFEMNCTEEKDTLKIYGTYQIENEKNDCKVQINHYQLNNDVKTEFQKDIKTCISHYGFLQIDYGTDPAFLIREIYPLPKLFNHDKIFGHEENKCKDFHITYYYYADGKFEMTYSNSKDMIRLFGTYENSSYDRQSSNIFITQVQCNDESKREYDKKFYTIFSEDGKCKTYEAENILRENYSYPKTFNEERIFKDDLYDYKITHTLFTNGKLEILMIRPKYIMKLHGTYERHPHNIDQVKLIISNSQLNDEPIKESLINITLYLDENRIRCYGLNNIFEFHPFPKTFDEDKIAIGKKYKEFEPIYSYFADGNLEITISGTVEDKLLSMKFFGTYQRNSDDYDDYRIIITQFQLDDEPKKEYVFEACTSFYSDGSVGCGYGNNGLKDMIFSNYSYPKLFEKDRIFANENNYYKDFKFTCTFYANGNFELTMSKTNIVLKLFGTYQRNSDNLKRCDFIVTRYQFNDDQEIEYHYEFDAWFDNLEDNDGKIDCYSLDRLLGDLVPIPKTFEEDIIISSENNREGYFDTVYTFYANGNFEILLVQPKCKLRLSGTYERDSTDKLRCKILLTNFQLDENSNNEYIADFNIYWQEEKVAFSKTNISNYVFEIFKICNLNLDISSLVKGQAFNKIIQASNRYYIGGSRCSYNSEDLLAYFYPDGSVTIKSHTEDYEDWGTDYDTKVYSKDYLASGIYQFLEKTSENEILVTISIDSPKEYADKVIEAKINSDSFMMFIKAEKFINQKFYY